MSKAELLLKLLPAVIQSVVSVEGAVKGSGKGRKKKAAVLAAVSAGAQSTGLVGKALDNKTLSAVGDVTDALVAALNASGVFKK